MWHCYQVLKTIYQCDSGCFSFRVSTVRVTVVCAQPLLDRYNRIAVAAVWEVGARLISSSIYTQTKMLLSVCYQTARNKISVGGERLAAHLHKSLELKYPHHHDG